MRVTGKFPTMWGCSAIGIIIPELEGLETRGEAIEKEDGLLGLKLRISIRGVQYMKP